MVSGSIGWADNASETGETGRNHDEEVEASGDHCVCADGLGGVLYLRVGIPAVVNNNRLCDLPTVVSNDALVGRMAAEHFLASGFRQFAFCSVTPEHQVRKRCEGFVRRLAEAGFPCAVFTDRYAAEECNERVPDRQCAADGSVARRLFEEASGGAGSI